MVERLDPSRVVVIVGTEEDAQQFSNDDYMMRSGVCPNSCGLLTPSDLGFQECKKCNFFCNVQAEKVIAH